MAVKSRARVLQSNVMDIEYCLACIHNTTAALERMRVDCDRFYDQFEKKCSALGLTESGGRQLIRYEKKRLLCIT